MRLTNACRRRVQSNARLKHGEHGVMSRGAVVGTACILIGSVDIDGKAMSSTGSKIWIALFTVFFPLIYVSVGFVILFGISWFLAKYVFASQPLPFWPFAVAGLVLGAAAVASNLRHTWPALIRLFGSNTSESAT